jgi:hypothetical protein
MRAVDAFCGDHAIEQSRSGDSYYFTLNGIQYRVSNHSVESSRPEYHPNGREADTVYIHASKTRVVEIYTDLLNGYALDGRGRRKAEA